MRRPWVASMVRAAVALVAGALGFTIAMSLLDTEAGGGRLTGPLIRLCLAGSVVLVLCAMLAFTRRRIVSLIAMAAAVMCLPLLVYRIAPGSSAWMTDAPSSIGSAKATSADPLAIGGLIAVAVVLAVFGRTRLGRPKSTA